MGGLSPHCAALCVGVCFRVAGVSCDVAVFADLSPVPSVFPLVSRALSLPSPEGTGLLGPGWGARARPPSPVSPQNPISLYW